MNAINVEVYRNVALNAVNDRFAFEQNHNSLTENKARILDKLKHCVSHDTLLEALMTAQFDATLINRSARDKRCFDVYAIDKIVNNVHVVATSFTSMNKMTLAIFTSLVALYNADQRLSDDDARACCSNHLKASSSLITQISERKDDSTVKVQYKSSLKSLIALNVVTEHNAVKKSEYSLNAQSEIAQRLAAKLNLKIKSDDDDAQLTLL